MDMRKRWIGVYLFCWLLLAACGSPEAASPEPTPALTLPRPTPPPTVDPFFASQGGGEPRTAGYWLVWNSCAEDNKADVAAANGGREAGWIILDDLLQDPGILLGEQAVETCPQGISLLRAEDFQGEDRAGDPVYKLAAQLLTAQLNLAAGTEYCPAVEEAVQAGQLLLLSLQFEGTGDYLGLQESSQNQEVVLFLIEQLSAYNVGSLCQ
jgi:hypothetical protein